MSSAQSPATGHCLCGKVRFEVRGPLSDAHACHCGQCRRQSGHFVVGTAAKREDFVLLAGETLAWFRSSPIAQRGFCSACGSVMFWDDGGSLMSINAGCLNQPTGLKITKHIFVDDIPDYYTLDDDLPKFRGYDTPA